MAIETKRVLAKWQRKEARNSATGSNCPVQNLFRTRFANRFRCDATTGGHVGYRYQFCLKGRKTIEPF